MSANNANDDAKFEAPLLRKRKSDQRLDDLANKAKKQSTMTSHDLPNPKGFDSLLTSLSEEELDKAEKLVQKYRLAVNVEIVRREQTLEAQQIHGRFFNLPEYY